MKTSYYKSPLLLPSMNLVRISTSAPKWFPYHLKPFPLLYPGWDLISQYKTGQQNQNEARKLYETKILQPLNPQKIWQMLGEDAVLLCWEKSGTFCHRRIVAEWLEKNLSITIQELSSQN